MVPEPICQSSSIHVPAAGGRYAAGPGPSSNQPHNNRPPYLGLTYIIALQGIFPPRA